MVDATPFNGADRPDASRALDLLDTPEEALGRLKRIATALFNVPTVLISLADDGYGWEESAGGGGLLKGGGGISFRIHTFGKNEPFVIPDARADHRFSSNPLVTGEPHIRFYAGARMRARDGSDLATFCLIDSKPRPALTGEQLALLEDLAASATLLIEQRRMVLDYEALADSCLIEKAQMRMAKKEADAFVETMRSSVSRVGHDLRTPLTAIMGFSGLLAESALSPEQRSDLAEIDRAAHKMLEMLESLRQDARQEETGENPSS